MASTAFELGISQSSPKAVSTVATAEMLIKPVKNYVVLLHDERHANCDKYYVEKDEMTLKCTQTLRERRKRNKKESWDSGR